MSYFEKVENAYRDSMRAYGVSEEVIKFLLAAFNTGFSAGVFQKEDIELQQGMVSAILNENNLN